MSAQFSLDRENLESVWRHFWTTFLATFVPVVLAVDFNNLDPKNLWVVAIAPALAAALRTAWLYFSGEKPLED